MKKLFLNVITEDKEYCLPFEVLKLYSQIDTKELHVEARLMKVVKAERVYGNAVPTIMYEPSKHVPMMFIVGSEVQDTKVFNKNDFSTKVRANAKYYVGYKSGKPVLHSTKAIIAAMPQLEIHIADKHTFNLW